MKQLDPPRWPGGPPICREANLPAFETEAALADFHERNGPGVKVLRKWVCPKCEGWHHEVTEAPPSGATSGNARVSEREPDTTENVTGWRRPKTPFLRNSTLKEMDDRRRRMEQSGFSSEPITLPVQRPAAKTERSVPLPRAPKSAKERNLL